MLIRQAFYVIHESRYFVLVPVNDGLQNNWAKMSQMCYHWNWYYTFHWILNESGLEHSCYYSFCMWGSWGTEESGIICRSHSACFLYIQPIAFKPVFTCLAWLNLEMTEKVWVCSSLLPLPSPHLEEIAWVMQIVCLLYLPVALYLCLWEWGMDLPTGLHRRISWGRAELESWGSKRVYGITGPTSQPWCCSH